MCHPPNEEVGNPTPGSSKLVLVQALVEKPAQQLLPNTLSFSILRSIISNILYSEKCHLV